MHRFFIPPESIQGERVVFPRTAAEQLRNVLRITPGDRVTILVDDGWEYEVEVTHIPNHLVMSSFPATVDELRRFDVVIISDCGRNTLTMYPNMFVVPMGPDRVQVIAEYVRPGEAPRPLARDPPDGVVPIRERKRAGVGRHRERPSEAELGSLVRLDAVTPKPLARR